MMGERQPAQKRHDDEARPRPSAGERSGSKELFLREAERAMGRRTEGPRSDLTFVPTLAGFLFLAVVMDAWRAGPSDGPSRPI